MWLKASEIYQLGELQYMSFVMLYCRYVTAVTTAASGYSYWHYGRKTVQVLNTRSP